MTQKEFNKKTFKEKLKLYQEGVKPFKETIKLYMIYLLMLVTFLIISSKWDTEYAGESL